MRGMFALVLVAGVAAGAALLMWEDGSEEDAPRFFDPKEEVVLSPDPGPDRPSDGAGGAVHDPGGSASRPEVPERADAVYAAVRRHLDAGKPDLAARTILAAEAGVLAHERLREDVFRTAELLSREAPRAAGERGTRMRIDARRLYAALYDCDASSGDELDRAYAGARELHRILISGAAAPDALVLRYKVKSGDSLWNLARGPWKKAGISVAPGFVLEVNAISDARRIRVGQTVRVPREKVSLLVRKERFEMAVLLGGAPVARFAVGLGANDSTPEGHFSIETKLKNPPWYYDGRKIPFGHPDNVIGTRWMGFSDTRDAEGIGIHGTVDESTIGQAVSLGCIRMKRVDVERLFEWLPYGCDVEVR